MKEKYDSNETRIWATAGDERTEVYVDSDVSLVEAAADGDLDWVRALIPLHNPRESDEALRVASRNGHIDVVRELVSVSDPAAAGGAALMAAAMGGHIEVVRLLIPLSKPMPSNSLMLMSAMKAPDAEVVRALLPVIDSDELIARRSSYRAEIRAEIDRYCAKTQRAELAQAIGCRNTAPLRKRL